MPWPMFLTSVWLVGTGCGSSWDFSSIYQRMPRAGISTGIVFRECHAIHRDGLCQDVFFSPNYLCFLHVTSTPQCLAGYPSSRLIHHMGGSLGGNWSQ